LNNPIHFLCAEFLQIFILSDNAKTRKFKMELASTVDCIEPILKGYLQFRRWWICPKHCYNVKV